MKLGLGLWRHRNLSLLAELAVLGVGWWIWRGSSTIVGYRRTLANVFIVLLVLITLATPFLPAPRDGNDFALQALAGYFILAAIAGWLDRPSKAAS
jgi:hypothetical protein